MFNRTSDLGIVHPSLPELTEHLESKLKKVFHKVLISFYHSCEKDRHGALSGWGKNLGPVDKLLTQDPQCLDEIQRILTRSIHLLNGQFSETDQNLINDYDGWVYSRYLTPEGKKTNQARHACIYLLDHIVSGNVSASEQTLEDITVLFRTDTETFRTGSIAKRTINHLIKLNDEAAQRMQPIMVELFQQTIATINNYGNPGMIYNATELLTRLVNLGTNTAVELPPYFSTLIRMKSKPGGLSESERNFHTLCKKATGAKPTAKWKKEAEEMLAQADQSKTFKHIIADSIRHIDAMPYSDPLTPEVIPDIISYMVSGDHTALRGIVWMTTIKPNDDFTRTLTTLALSAYKKEPGIGPRAVKVGNACIYALSEIPGDIALAQLAIIKARVKFRTAQNLIGKALIKKAADMGVSPEEVEEMAVPTYGLEEVGQAREELGDFTAILEIEASDKTLLTWENNLTGKIQKSVPASVKDKFSDEIKDLKASARDIGKMLPVQKQRLDSLYLQNRSWTYGIWKERYLDHPLIGHIARRLIWTFSDGDQTQDAIGLDGNLVDLKGNRLTESTNDTIVTLWHPIHSDENTITKWRQFLEDHLIQQPLKQAHREIYLLTPAEEETSTYSNRFASHIIKQHQFNALCLARDWKNSLRLMVDDDYPPASRALSAWNLRADFWVEGAGDEYGVATNNAGTYLYLSTDQVRFYPIDARVRSAHASGGGYSTRGNESDDAPLPLNTIPPIVLSEIMRDIDLFVGVASVGNDPNWLDHGPDENYQAYWQSFSFGDLSTTAKSRKEILQKLIPRLKIADQCQFDDKFLIVKGTFRSYKIHMGSGNILMSPHDQYLCIVQKQSVAAKSTNKIFLPFEGDGKLALILSKAFLLAADDKIKDLTMLAQIKPKP